MDQSSYADVYGEASEWYLWDSWDLCFTGGYGPS